ncbi:DUF4238 domain-containing protein [Haloarcula montana]|uniref:DUF4238 domain-containing protein n=1 Tax=Haloarcula montana TaxID=3111776 RepID=UPI002D772F0F|nr:DUF4238 domain-containing protein [Haloarcula sp. GH36]
MPPYKNQHYVPQHYLRPFANSDDRLCAYNIERETEFPPTPISNLCSEDWFYGGAEQEKSISPFEAECERILQQLRDAQTLSVVSGEDYRNLLRFILFQRMRTKQEKEDMDKMLTDVAEEIAEMGVESGEIGEEALNLLREDKLTVSHESMHPRMILSALLGPEYIADLRGVLLINGTDTGFITSDHPVIMDNPKFKRQRDRFLGGLQSPGLQIFCPISPNRVMFLYDSDHYQFTHGDNPASLRVRRVETVKSINTLQVLNALDNVLYTPSGRENEMKELHSNVKSQTRKRKLETEVHEEGNKISQSGNEVIEFGPYLPDYSPNIPFLEQTTKKWSDIERRQGVSDAINQRIESVISDAENDG